MRGRGDDIYIYIENLRCVILCVTLCAIVDPLSLAHSVPSAPVAIRPTIDWNSTHQHCQSMALVSQNPIVSNRNPTEISPTLIP